MNTLPSLIETIKKAAIEAVEYEKPMKFFYGVVESTDPLKINIESRIGLTEEFLILTNNVKDHRVKVRFDSSIDTQNITIYRGLNQGDKVVLIQAQGGQKYIVLDKVSDDD